MKGAYSAELGQGAVPRPVIMPLVRGELVGLIWVRPFTAGDDGQTAVAELSNIAAAAGADEVVLAWETDDVATACRLPVSGPAPCLNMVHATRDGHVLHRFPYEEQAGAGSPAGPRWLPPLAPEPAGALVPPVQAAVDYAFIPMEMDHPNPFGVTVVLMEKDGHQVRLSETFAR